MLDSYWSRSHTYMRNCRILLVDDYLPFREAVRNLLGIYEDIDIIGEARDGKKALDLATASRPDVIVLDLNMPIMNGIETARLIRRSGQEVLIIGLCAVDDPDCLEAFAKAGASVVLPKERLQELYPTIRSLWTNTPLDVISGDLSNRGSATDSCRRPPDAYMAKTFFENGG
jgi:DNA-binding NarL/FixJ family response regulator